MSNGNRANLHTGKDPPTQPASSHTFANSLAWEASWRIVGLGHKRRIRQEINGSTGVLRFSETTSWNGDSLRRITATGSAQSNLWLCNVECGPGAATGDRRAPHRSPSLNSLLHSCRKPWNNIAKRSQGDRDVLGYFTKHIGPLKPSALPRGRPHSRASQPDISRSSRAQYVMALHAEGLCQWNLDRCTKRTDAFVLTFCELK